MSMPMMRRTPSTVISSTGPMLNGTVSALPAGA